MMVPTLSVTVGHGSGHASSAERGASLAAFPRRAWEWSICKSQVGCQAFLIWAPR